MRRNSPLERGASSTFFKGLEEAGCVAREPALGLDKMLNLVAFGTGMNATRLISAVANLLRHKKVTT